MRPLLYPLVGLPLVGALLGHGEGIALEAATNLPGLIFTLALITMPALYVGLAVTGSPRPPREILAASSRALSRMGILCLGLCPALAFMAATSTSGGAPFLLGHLVVFAAVTTALMSLRHDLGVTVDTGFSFVLYGGWALVGLAIGAGLWIRNVLEVL